MPCAPDPNSFIFAYWMANTTKYMPPLPPDRYRRGEEFGNGDGGWATTPMKTVHTTYKRKLNDHRGLVNLFFPFLESYGKKGRVLLIHDICLKMGYTQPSSWNRGKTAQRMIRRGSEGAGRPG
jgi:hypothetical protein